MYIYIYIYISGVQVQKNKRKLYISQLQLSRMFTIIRVFLFPRIKKKKEFKT